MQGLLVDMLVACRKFCLALALLLAVPLSVLADIRIGLEPLYSTRFIISSYQPLRDYLGQQLGQKIVLLTAANQQDYLRNLDAGEYDVAIASPLVTRYLQKDAGWDPLLKTAPRFTMLLLVLRESRLVSADGLAEGVIVMPGMLTYGSMQAEMMLEQNGLAQHERWPRRYLDNAQIALSELVRGNAVAAVVNNLVYGQMTADQRARLKIIGISKPVIHQMVAVRPGFPGTLAGRIQGAILAFSHTSQGSSGLAARAGFTGIRTLEPADFAAVDGWLPAYHKRLAEGRS